MLCSWSCTLHQAHAPIELDEVHKQLESMGAQKNDTIPLQGNTNTLVINY